MRKIKKRWFLIIGIAVLIAGFIVYQFFGNRLIPGSVVDLMISQQYDSNYSVSREEIEHRLALDKPFYTQIFSNVVVPAPQTYPVGEYYSSSDSNQSITYPTILSVTTTATDSVFSQRMIVRTANLTILVNDIPVAVSQITQLTNDNNGYVVSANRTSTDKSVSGVVSIRVPAAQFDSIMDSLRTMAVKVTSDNISATDVSEEYSDLSAKLKNLETAEAQLTEIMKKAEKVEDVLAVQKQLTATRGEIETTKGKIQYLEQTSAMSLITINLEQATVTVSLIAGTRYANAQDNIGFVVSIKGGISPYSYQWDFGDGTTSIEAEPWHKYRSSGDYTVTVTVTDDKGNTAIDRRVNYVYIYPGWSPGDIFSSAWRGLLSFFRFLFVIIVWLLLFSPMIIAVGVIWYFARRSWKKRKAKTLQEKAPGVKME